MWEDGTYHHGLLKHIKTTEFKAHAQTCPVRFRRGEGGGVITIKWD